jgi:hypothetical protein
VGILHRRRNKGKTIPQKKEGGVMERQFLRRKKEE